ncbi:MAG: bifunctional riboflavin kinase/FAD synthetase [Candidatus Gastranaerophilales bacterium]|nr:bifunctional riboflavin kinase/FAD synthetase [Candidatus Gastranaerophilales bacterium]
MQIYNQFIEKKNLSLALGFFDGLHEGHKVVIKTAVNFAKENNAESGIVIFKEHPMSYITKNSVKQIITLEDKINILKKLNVDNVFLVSFDDYLAKLSATSYLKDILIKYFSPIAITTGFNHSFGHNRQGNSSFLKSFQTKYNYRYFEIPPITCNNIITSSSSIRNALSCGNLELANKLLGYNFFIKAKVIQGQKLGRKLDFPTANFVYPDQITELPSGVYIANIEVNNKIYKSVLNYGYRPTVSDELKLIGEAHLLDFGEDIYDKNIKISFVTKIRNEVKFFDVQQLKSQIIRDIEFAKNYNASL